MWLLECHETSDLKVCSIHIASVRPFGGLKKRFFKMHENLGCRIHDSRFATFRQFGGLKSNSCHVVKSSTPGQLPSYQPQLDILATWKCDFSRVIWPSDKGYVAFIEIKFSILAAWKCVSLSFLVPSAHGYVANYERETFRTTVSWHSSNRIFRT
jgi:hypothetical protein